MKTTKFIVILLLVSLLGKAQKIPKNSYWLAIESRPILNGWINMDGMVLHFDTVNLNIQNVLFDTTESYLYTVKSDTIFIKDSILCTIYFFNKDSLLLDFDNYTRVKYIPIIQNPNLNSNMNFWKHEDFNFIHYDNKSELKLQDKIWGSYPNEVAKLALIQSMGKKYKYSNVEKWNIFEINKSEIFILSIGQYDIDYYFINQYSDDSVILFNLNQPDSIAIISKEKIISNNKKDSICALLSEHWTSSKIYDYAAWWHDIENWDGTEFTGMTREDTMFFKKSSLENDRLMFYFENNFNYEFYENDTLKLTGNWRLSNNGKQIVLENGWYEERYIDIIALDSNRMMLGKQNRFWTENRKKHYADYYYIIEMHK